MLANNLKHPTLALLLIAGIVLSASYTVTRASAQGDITLTPGSADQIGTLDVSTILTTADLPTVNLQLPFLVPNQQAFATGQQAMQQAGFTPPSIAAQAGTGSHAVSSDLSIRGVGGASPNPCGCTPPDVASAVGPNHVVEFVNLAGIIFNKDGSVAKSQFPLSSFFLQPDKVANDMSDPYILYDAVNGRWYATVIAGIDFNNAETEIGNSNFKIVLAVSANSDPTGTWALYQLKTPVHNILPDQPFIGYNDDKLVVSGNDFDCSFPLCNSYIGVQYWILSKAELLAFASHVDLFTNNPADAVSSNTFTLRPVQHLASTSSNGNIFYLVSTCTGTCLVDPFSTSSTATVYAITGTPPSTPSVRITTFTIQTVINPPPPLQPGGVVITNAIDDRIVSIVWRNNDLWFTMTDGCIPFTDTALRSCARLIEATTSGTTPPVEVQDFDFHRGPRNYVFYPAVSLDIARNLVLVYGHSSTQTTFPALEASGRFSTDPVATLEPFVTIAPGRTGALETSTRYGDYFSAGVDPDSPLTFWVAGEFAQTADSLLSTTWSTALGRLSVTANPQRSYIWAGDNIVVRPTLSASIWLDRQLGTTPVANWGVSGDIPLIGKVDGDVLPDIAVWRPSTGQFLVLQSSNGYSTSAPMIVTWGSKGDTPFLADFDHDGRDDFIVWRPSPGQWRILTSSTGYDPAKATIIPWSTGAQNPGDIPLIADVDGDGRIDLGAWRSASTATFRVLTSSTNYNPTQATIVAWGTTGDVPFLGETDLDGKADFIVYRPSAGAWLIDRSSHPPITVSLSGDIPLVMGTKNPDFCTGAIATFTRLTAQWNELFAPSFDPANQSTFNFGAGGDTPFFAPEGGPSPDFLGVSCF